MSKGTLRFKVDTDADASAISDKHLDLMRIKETEIKQTRKNLIGPGGEKLKLFRICEHHTQLEWQKNPAGHVCVQKFAETVLGKPAIREMNIITFIKPRNLSLRLVTQKKKMSL